MLCSTFQAYLNSLQGSAVIKNPSSHENAPNKNNIILMNPEIHVHNNNKSASGSPNNVEEIKVTTFPKHYFVIPFSMKYWHNSFRMSDFLLLSKL